MLGRIRELRGGKLYDPNFGSRLRGEGPLAEQINALFTVARRKAGLDGPPVGLNRTTLGLSSAAFRVPTNQLSLFGD